MISRRRPAFALLGIVLVLGLSGCQNQDGGNGANPLGAPPGAAPPASIVGEITLPDQDDASGVQVYIPGTNHVSITDQQGAYALEGIGPGTFEVLARAEGFERATIGRVVVIASGKIQQYRLAPATLTRAKPTASPAARGNQGAIRGQVLLAGARAATVGIDWSHCMVELEKTRFRTACASDGSFFLWSLPPDQYTLLARMEGFEPAHVDVRVLPGPEETTLTLPLSPAEAVGSGTRRIHGLVEMFGPDGKPTNDFDKVAIQVAGRPMLSTRLGPDGAFALENLLPRRYQLTATATGYAPASPVDIDLTNLPETDVQFTLHALQTTTSTLARIHGVALKNDEKVQDMSGISVALTGGSKVAVTDATGQYAIGEIPPGRYTILAQAQGFQNAEQGPIELKAGDDIEIESLLLEPILDYPTVVSTDPADGSRNVIIQREIPVTIRFSKKMNAESVRQAVSIDPVVAFRATIGDPDPDVLRVLLIGSGDDPVARFRTRYTLHLSEDAKDQTGLALQEPFGMSLTTGDPSVIGTIPENNGTQLDLSPGTPVSILFNAPMDPASITADTLRIRPPLDSSPNMSLVTAQDTGWTRLNISAQWRPNSLYRVTILRHARTIGRNALSNTPYTFTFKTIKLRLFEPPAMERSLRR